MEKANLLLTLAAPQVRTIEKMDETHNDRDRLTRSFSSLRGKGRALKHSSPHVFRTRSTGTLSRKQKQKGETDDLLEQNDDSSCKQDGDATSESQRKVQNLFRIWKLFRDRTKENAGVEAKGTDLSRTIISFLEESTISIPTLKALIILRQQRARSRNAALNHAGSFLQNVKITSAREDLLQLLLAGFVDSSGSNKNALLPLEYHYMDRVEVCLQPI